MASDVEPIYGTLPNKWHMGSVALLVEDGEADVQTGPFGTMLHASAYQPEGTPVVAVKNIGNNGLIHDDIPRVSHETSCRLSRYQLQQGDILFGRKGAVERRAYICAEEEGWLQGSDCIRLRLIGPNVDSRFVSLVLGSEAYRGWITQHAQGATMPSLNQEIIKRIPLPLPPLNEQQAIAQILGTLDDKIDLNRRMNETLAAMARALFKSWFVDFDPVRAKAEGRDPGLPKPLADLFPDSFEPSSVGRIPTGWREGRLDEMVLLQRGFDLPAPNRTPGPYPVMAASGPSGTHAEYKVKGPGITTGRSGVLGKVFLVHEDFWPLNTSLWVKEFRGARPIYAFHLLRGLDFEVFNAGSAVPTLNRNHVHGLPVVLPPLALVERFEEVVAPMYQKANRKEQESGTVAALRDTLLPKLISGELRVKGVETTEALRHRG